LPPKKIKSYLGHGDSLSSHSLAAPSKSFLTDGLGIDFCDVQYSLWIYLVTTEENSRINLCSSNNLYTPHITWIIGWLEVKIIENTST
jgi:hypothetical protein